MDLHATTVPLDNLLVAGRHVQTATKGNFLVAVPIFCALFVEVEVTPTNKHRHRTQEILTMAMVDLHIA